MATFVDITGDVAIDVDTRRAFPLFITAPPEAEGYTCGLYFAGEEGAEGYVEEIMYGAYISTAITLGPGDWSDGQLVWDNNTLVSDALRQINEYLKFIEDNSIGTDIVLGDDVATDGSSLWDDGAVALTPTTTVSEAFSEINKFLKNSGGGATDGIHLPLGSISDYNGGDWADGEVELDDTTPVSEAIYELNAQALSQADILALLTPAQPPAFPNGSLAVANGVGNSPRLAIGVTDNTSGSGLTAGAAVTRITASGVNSNTFNDVGPGNQGTINLSVNGTVVGTRALNGTSDNGTYNGLVISDQKDFPPATPGFWKSIDVSVSAASALQGINNFKVAHTAAGTTNTVVFVRDNLTSTPVISASSVVEATPGTYAYSSGVPHYGTGGSLLVNLSMSNLAGETYYGGSDPLTISGTNGIMSGLTATYAGLNISTPIARQSTAAVAVAAQTVSVDGSNAHISGVVQGTARNVNGASAATTLAAKTILVKRGSANGRVDENSVTVSGLGTSPNANNAVRVSMGSGDKPALTMTAWDSTAALPAYEASVVGGILSNDQTNYSNGSYLPIGPDYSVGRNGAQYASYVFERTALSAFKINVQGTYAGMLIALPGISDAQPNGGGWWDMFQSYTGAGVPGGGSDVNAGCALGTTMNGSSGSFQGTFGTASSTNSTSNEVIVRVKLNPGQSISSLTFTN